MEIVISERRRFVPVTVFVPNSMPHTLQRVAVPLKRVPQRGHTSPVVGLLFVFALISCLDASSALESNDYTSSNPGSEANSGVR
jgi:hypothetical protein